MDRAAATEERIVELAEALNSTEARAADRGLLERIAVAQENVAEILSNRDEEAGQLDVETRSRLRSIDTQVLRILEDLSAGRQDVVAEIRQELSGLTEALRSVQGQTRR